MQIRTGGLAGRERRDAWLMALFLALAGNALAALLLWLPTLIVWLLTPVMALFAPLAPVVERSSAPLPEEARPFVLVPDMPEERPPDARVEAREDRIARQTEPRPELPDGAPTVAGIDLPVPMLPAAAVTMEPAPAERALPPPEPEPAARPPEPELEPVARPLPEAEPFQPPAPEREPAARPPDDPPAPLTRAAAEPQPRPVPEPAPPAARPPEPTPEPVPEPAPPARATPRIRDLRATAREHPLPGASATPALAPVRRPGQRNLQTSARLGDDVVMAALKAKYGAYMEEVQKRIDAAAARAMVLDQHRYKAGVVVGIRFGIAADGRLSATSVIEPDDEQLAEQVLGERLLRDAAPFPPLTREMQEDPDFQKMTLGVFFF
jgi:hypothetical protein